MVHHCPRYILHQQMIHSQLTIFGGSYKYSLGEITRADDERPTMEDAEHPNAQENIKTNSTIMMSDRILTS